MTKKKPVVAVSKSAAKAAKKAKAAQKVERKEKKKVTKSKYEEDGEDEDLEAILDKAYFSLDLIWQDDDVRWLLVDAEGVGSCAYCHRRGS